jgi:hypothetical protein
MKREGLAERVRDAFGPEIVSQEWDDSQGNSTRGCVITLLVNQIGGRGQSAHLEAGGTEHEPCVENKRRAAEHEGERLGKRAGGLSMGVGEYISVSSQLDTEKADIEKEVEAHATASGRAHELEELAQIYVARGLDYQLARQVLPTHLNQLACTQKILCRNAVNNGVTRPFCTTTSLLGAHQCMQFVTSTLHRCVASSASANMQSRGVFRTLSCLRVVLSTVW